MQSHLHIHIAQEKTQTIFFFTFPKGVLGVITSCSVFTGRIIPVSLSLRKGVQEGEASLLLPGYKRFDSSLSPSPLPLCDIPVHPRWDECYHKRWYLMITA